MQPNQAMTIYGDKQEITDMANRYKAALKGGDKLNNNEIYALAQVARITGLNPFVGEVWCIPGKGTMIGIAGARKLWQEQSRTGGGFSFVEIVPCSPEEAGATENDVVVAFKAIAHDSKATKEYQQVFLETVTALRSGGSSDPVGEARHIVGPKPEWVGYGYSTKSESSRMNKTQLARKRAEADALKKCVVIPFGVEIAAQDTGGHAEINPQEEKTVDAEFTEETPMTYDEARQLTVKVKGGEKFIGELTKEQLDYLIEHGTDQRQIEAAKIVLKQDFNME